MDYFEGFGVDLGDEPFGVPSEYISTFRENCDYSVIQIGGFCGFLTVHFTLRGITFD